MTPPPSGDETSDRHDWSRLMAAAQEGDRHAYDRLLREIVPFIRAVIQRQHGSAARRDEVVQDVLLTLHRVRHTYDPTRPFTYWLASIARRRSIDALRRLGRTESPEIYDPTAYETFADPQANRTLEVRHATEGLAEAIAELPERQREAVTLLKLRELSLIEASRLSGTSVGALKVNVHRAIKALRKQLGGARDG
jgi:RNA polymerase sigma factor (sigma-70 family)